MTVYKTPTHIFIVTPTPQRQNENLIEMQIFFKEFKDHLERYLDIHRKVWEEISDIKEREEIFGKDVSEHRAKLDSYQKTISLIKSRINQMGPYARTRSSLSKYLKVEDQLASLFQYKFEDLFSTLSYIKDLWGMTSEYVNAAIGVVKEIESKAAASSLRSIQVLASLGFVAGLISYLTKTDLPVLSPIGIGYFVGLIALTFIISKVVRTFYQNKKYSLKFTERAKGL